MVIETSIQYAELTDIMQALNDRGNFVISVLTDESGLLLASSDQNPDTSEMQSAVGAQVQGLVQRVVRHLSMAEPEEITLNDVEGKRLVCRPFRLGDATVILAVLIPTKGQAYRKLMNQAIRSIQQTWNF